MPATLKNAFDYLSAGWAWKPCLFVGYGNTSAGTRGVQMARGVAASLRMLTIGGDIFLRRPWTAMRRSCWCCSGAAGSTRRSPTRGSTCRLLAFAEARAPEGVAVAALFTGEHSDRNILMYEKAGYSRSDGPVPAGAVRLTKPLA